MNIGENNKQKRLSADERRSKILNVALERFSSNGYAATTMEEIANKAECSTGPLYHFYKTKADIFHALMEKHFELAVSYIVNSRSKAESESPLSRLRVTIQVLLSGQIHLPTAQMFIRESANVLGEEAWRSMVDRIMLKGIEHDLRNAMMENLINPEPPEPLAQAITAAVLMALERAGTGTRDLELPKNAILRIVDRLEIPL